MATDDDDLEARINSFLLRYRRVLKRKGISLKPPRELLDRLDQEGRDDLAASMEAFRTGEAVGPSAEAPAPLGGSGLSRRRFRFGKRIGGGGMGVVYEADDLWLGRKVAVKVLRRKLVGQPGEADRPAGERVGQQLAATGAVLGAAVQAERHVGAEGRRDRHQLGAVAVGLPQRSARDQRGGGVGAAAGHPPRDRDPLGDLQPYVRADARPLGERQGGAGREVAEVRRDIRRALPADHHAEAGGRHRRDLVGNDTDCSTVASSWKPSRVARRPGARG